MNVNVFKLVLLALLLSLLQILTACSHVQTSQDIVIPQKRFEMPLLQPKDWGVSFTQTQVLNIKAHNQEHQVQAVLEVNNQAVQLVLLKFGQRLMSLHFDGYTTRIEKETYAPEFLQPQQVFQDIQILYADAEKLRQVLPVNCHLLSTPNMRELTCNSEVIYQIYYNLSDATNQSLKRTRLINQQNQYAITVDAIGD
ncbi:DUF3261 domain-containing protein [Hydromonas duriensis]|uniref:Uncharacterized protein DUF3261 n=1 Tax=Hydromonas duriensis TaxID=1527608 RepID=A0A4R6Y5K5_9BURK|nr:DUF3261 domain-containing protein [Hydromonas duriensis]TDR30737.1 uncharacterized protein DUF3261 [Hydromonas duriensis]